MNKSSVRKLILIVLLLCPCLTFEQTAIATVKMHNVQGEVRTVTLFASQVKRHVVTVDEVYGGAESGDHIISGRFFITIRASNGAKPIRQHMPIFGSFGIKGEFNKERGIAFVLSGSAGHADILCIVQHGDSSNAALYLSYIDKNLLRPIKIQSASEKYQDCLYMERTNKDSRLHYNADGRLQCMEYLQGIALFRKYVWSFSLGSGRLDLWDCTLFVEDETKKSMLICGYKEKTIIMVPLLAISESLGAKITFNQQQKQYSIVNAGTSIAYTVGTTRLLVNGMSVMLPHASTRKSGVLYVPLQQLATALGADIKNTLTDSNNQTTMTLETITGKSARLLIFPNADFGS